MNKSKAIFNWSGGKDSSLAMHRLQQTDEYKITHLLTTVNGKYKRISMHGVREELLDQQAKRLGIPLHKVIMPDEPSMETYNDLMKETMMRFREQENDTSVFGDIFLEDLRKYREEQLKTVGFKAVFPIWKIPTDQLAKEFVDRGFKAIAVCIDERYLDISFAGREMDRNFFRDLPEDVDPCGENGEFHSFVYDGPIFNDPISVKRGEIVYRTYKLPGNPEDRAGFWYCDLVEA